MSTKPPCGPRGLLVLGDLLCGFRIIRIFNLVEKRCPALYPSNVLRPGGSIFMKSRLGLDRLVRRNRTFTQRQTIRAAIGLLSLAILWINPAAGQQVPTAASAKSDARSQQTPPLIDRQKEIALALSACPPSVSGKAAVYVLEKSGYAKIREGQNGFTAIVGHLVPTSVEPLCMNEEATRSHLPLVLKVAELRAQGKSPDEIKRFIDDGFARGIFQPPSRTSVCYMLSTENVVPSDKGVVEPFPPHVMFYVPYLTNAELGAYIGPDGNPAGPAFVAREGTRDAVIIIPTATHAGSSHSSASRADQSSGTRSRPGERE